MRVLVVDDEARMAALIQRGLEDEGYAVDTVGDGSEALWMATAHNYDAIVLDVMLPGYDGIQVCRRLREGGRRTPVLMLTARSEVTERVRGLDAGADDYLVKPFSFSELVARLRALARRGPGVWPGVLNVGDLQLDPASRQVWRGGTEVTLSPKEFALLELFMRHPGKPLTRSYLIEHVWDFAQVGLSNIADQYVGYLRRKIDRPFGRQDLETVWGVGYRLRLPKEP
jgi:two-component system OmpR family response regulator